MKLTRAAEYAIRGVLGLALHAKGQTPVLVSRIAEEQEVSAAFLAKIFQQLTKARIVKSHRGVKGGFTLGRDANQITIRNVMEAIEGPTALNQCLVHVNPCKRADKCPVGEIWRKAQKSMLDVLDSASIGELVSHLKESENSPGRPGEGSE